MSMAKVYPQFVPSTQVHHEAYGKAFGDKFKGHAECILTQSNIDFISAFLENMEGSTNQSFEPLLCILEEGKKRMQDLHSLLGAFDSDVSSDMLTKPDSELINWNRPTEPAAEVK